jgi:hypothetical protein
MSDLPTPDYAEEIKSEYAQLRAAAEDFITHVVRLGEKLIAQKARLKHGEFIPWVQANCPFSHDTANKYMLAATNPNYEHARNLSLREFLEKPKLITAAETLEVQKSREDAAARVRVLYAQTEAGRAEIENTQRSLPPFAPLATSPDKLLYCSFCGKGQDEVRTLIAGPSARCGCCGKPISAAFYVCDECIELCSGIINDSRDEQTHRALKSAGKAKPDGKTRTKTTKRKNP